MNRRFPSALASVLSFVCTTLIAVGQTTAPPVPPLTKEQKEAAAAIEAPKTAMPPPLPGQMANGAPAKPAAAAAPAAPAASDNSASKMQALEAATQKPAGTEVPRVSTPADKLPVTSSTSTSRQFIVHGKVFETRSAMSTHCEEVSDEVRKVLNDKEPWVLPIVVLLNTGEEAAKSKGPPISTTISELSFGGFHLQVTINEGPGLKKEELRKELVRALLAERILRNHQKIEVPEGRLLLPDWIMTGVLHALDYRASPAPSAMFATLFNSGKVYGIEEIIEASPVKMDNLSRTIYETSCCALVLALVDQPNGPQNLNKFLNSLASDPRSERELISVAFPNFAASASSLNKWWSLQLAALAKPGVSEPLGAAESLRAIEEAITIHYEALPTAVPKNVKLHPFVIPAPLPVIAASESDTQSQAAPELTKSKTKELAAEVKKEPAQEDPKEKRSLLRRLLFLGDASGKESEPKAADEKDQPTADEEKKPGFMSRLFGAGSDEKKTPDEPSTKESTPKVADKPAETPAAVEKEKTGEEEKKPGFMGRLFGAGSDDKKTPEEPSVKESTPKVAEKLAATPPAVKKDKKGEEEKKPGFMGRLFGTGSDEKKPENKPAVTATADKKASEKEKAAAIEKPKVIVKKEPEAEEETKEEKKPTKLNPMNWFRGGKKSEEEKKEETPAKEKEAFLTPPDTIDVARLISPLMADAWQMLAPAAPRPTTEPLFDFRKRKPKAEEPRKEEPPAQKPEKESPPVKKSSKPRTTNPNSQPASKPSAKTSDNTSDKPKTTNPNAKPATPEQAQAVSAATPNAGPALVPVSLPLEEYQHILKNPDRAKILATNTASLRALELRVSVLFRPVIRGYLVAVHDIEAGRTKDMDKRLAALHEFAIIAYQKSIAVRDYLDWFEASESGRLSGKFDDYLNLPATIQKELPPRTDPISKYLDAIDKEFTK
jgi:hypothetical protein